MHSDKSAWRGALRTGLCLSALAFPLEGVSAALPLPPPPQAASTPVQIRPPSSAENPAPAPVTSTPVPPVQVEVRSPAMPTIGGGVVPLAPPSVTGVTYGPPGSSSTQAPLPAPTSRAPGQTPTPRTPGQTLLPVPTDRPMVIDAATDPILGTALRTASAEDFRRLVVTAVRDHPAINENAALAEEAKYARDQQRAQYYPSAEVDVPGFKVLGRQFQGDSIDNIVERTRADHRFDALATVNQLVTDFGATANRVKAAGERLRAAAYGVDNAADQVALNTVAAWYDVYSLRTILALTTQYRSDATQNRAAIQQRISGGASAPADAALIENSIAQLDIRIARFRQQLASAEARFRELTGSPAPAGLLRAPELGSVPATIGEARDLAQGTATTNAARAQAVAAERDAKATKRELLPNVSTSLNAGRYGLYQDHRDYDVVARLTLRQRFFGGLPERARSASAHANAMDARATRITQEDARDAETAFSDLESLDQQQEALQASYLATLRTRDATIERFRYSRGTLFDVLNASDTFYAAAIGYIQALAQRDAARYVLLSRTGRLLDAFGIAKFDAGKFNR